MIIIFGTKNITKNYGVTNKIECPHCHNTEFWHYLKTGLWFTLFWIPIFPLGSSKHFLVCPICNVNIALNGSDREKYRKLAELNQKFTSGKISEEEYRELSNDIQD